MPRGYDHTLYIPQPDHRGSLETKVFGRLPYRLLQSNDFTPGGRNTGDAALIEIAYSYSDFVESFETARLGTAEFDTVGAATAA